MHSVCGSVRVGGGSPKIVWWNDQVKATVKSKKEFGRRCWELEIRCKGKMFGSLQKCEEKG